MRIGYSRGLSDREHASAKEFRDFAAAESKKERLAEDRQMYERYVADLAREMVRVPVSLQVRPLPFDEWRALMPAGEETPELRGIIATHQANLNANWRSAKKQAQQRLSDEQLSACGFVNLDFRPEYVTQDELIGDGDMEKLREDYRKFRAGNPEYDHETHFDDMAAFFSRNKLCANFVNMRAAWSILTELALASPAPAPLPAPAQNKELNSYGVNLNIAPPSAEFERQEAQRKYRTEIVVTDPKDGKGYTQFQTDHFMDASTFQRLFLSGTPNVRDVIDPWVK
jgi:hypothetical protein